MTGAPKYEGTRIKLGGETFIVPPLNLRAIRQLREKIKALRNLDPMAGIDQLDIMVELIEAAMKRNYPDITRERIEEDIDTVNIVPLMRAIISMSGLEPKKESIAGEAAAGETPS